MEFQTSDPRVDCLSEVVMKFVQLSAGNGLLITNWSNNLGSKAYVV